MKLTIIGGCGAWPEPGRACSGYLLEHEGFRLLIDPGYSTFSLLSKRVRPEQIDAVLVTHGHPDHCADLSPLLRARAMGGHKPEVLPLYAPAGALDAVWPWTSRGRTSPTRFQPCPSTAASRRVRSG